MRRRVRNPQYAETPTSIVRTASEIIDYCDHHASERHSIYWRRIGDGDPAFAMCVFTSDGFLILGLSTHEDAAVEFFRQLKDHAASTEGYIDFENPPPDSAREFRDRARKALT